MADHNLNTLEAALDRAVAAAVDAQAARDESRERAGLPKSPPAFFTAAQMIAELCAAHDRHRAETRETISATVAEVRSRLDPNYRDESPDLSGKHQSASDRAIDNWLCRLIDAEERADARGDQPRNTAGQTSGTVVPMATAQQIVEAGRKRRNET